MSGIKNLTVNGLDLIIETNDGNRFVMTFPKPADGLNGLDGIDGKSIVNVKINNDNHLICSLDDGTDIDAGEIKGVGGGLFQSDRKSDFPVQGKEDTLYLARDKETLYYWNGINYQSITSNELEILAELETNEIDFDGNSMEYSLPIDDVNINVYVNGICLSENRDYTLDRSVSPNSIRFNDIYESDDICKINYLKKVEKGSSNFEYATDSDIDNLFEGSEQN